MEEVLTSRELREYRQRELLQQGGQCLISFSLNIAGNIKQFPMAQSGFESSLQELKSLLPHPPLTEQLVHSKIGSNALLLLPDAAEPIKSLTISLEEAHPLGSLLDIDVLNKKGQSLSRTQFGLPPRSCLICSGLSKECARSQIHPLEELRQETSRILDQYHMDRGANQISNCAMRALLYEVSATPKPGLVDRNNSGAHSDMDFFTFLDSSVSLAPWFQEFYCIGYRYSNLEPDFLFPKLRFAGRRAEEAMFAATGGVNTHKGAIFSIGLLCGAMGKMHIGAGNTVAISSLLRLVAQLALESTKKANQQPNVHIHTTGEQLYADYGILGAKGEAQAGFPNVSEVGLPTLWNNLQNSLSLNDAAVCTLIALIAQVEDTNLIHRSSIKEAHHCRNQAAELLPHLTSQSLVPQVEQLDREYIRRNLSPGGCADLLTLSLMLYFCLESGLLTKE